METVVLTAAGSLAWVDPGSFQLRASMALAVPGGCLLCDPVDLPGLDAAIAGLGPVVGVWRLLDRHNRDAEAVAARHGLAVADPLGTGGSPRPAPLAGVEARALVDRPGWRESALWLAEQRLLVVPEALGTAHYFLRSPRDRLGVHPLLRPALPRAAARWLRSLEPAAIAVGHGPPLVGDAAPVALREALATRVSGLPRAWLHAALGAR